MTRPHLLLRAVAAGLLLCAAGRAVASEQSERLYSRGLVEFHAARYTQALQLFTQAVQADAHDPYALYYRGVTEGRLGDYSAAARDLRAALAVKPDLPQAPLELGVALVQNGSYRDAIPWLEKAAQARDTQAQASLFLGIAQVRLGDTAAARQNLMRAAATDSSLDLTARYYLGVADYRDGRWTDAQERFSSVKTASPNSEMGREAAAFLTRMREGAPRRAYSVFGSVGFQYDSNVVLAPSNEAVKSNIGISKQADGRAIIEAGGFYSPLRTEHAELTLGYDFFQSLHFDLDKFNLQDHRPSAQFVVNTGPVQLGILGQYDYYFRRADSFLQEATALPWLAVNDTSAGRLDLYYRMRRRDFLQKPFSGVLDSFNHAVGVRQFFYLDTPARYLAVGYRFDHEDPINAAGDQYSYDGNEVNGGLGWSFPLGFSAEADYAYRHENYAPASAIPAATSRRRDDVHQAVLAFHKQLTENLRVTAAYFGTFNNSNKVLFDYDDQIGSVSLEVSF